MQDSERIYKLWDDALGKTDFDHDGLPLLDRLQWNVSAIN